ncbi:GNAT family N-acetyltransferase [Hymenobacter cellulosilyticus]|uniref:N-acetyltransferase n=1 Tax=Hymenobacter cellulosilyticus TaxID=2932248 RepID=A0A8T9Q4T7_9BACT|nr:GNAT family N-acetyltransferase [Hymenobacter cellulosilyticus]UOQ70103.1 N-acetyltransferase [Hymenobacter cellulosilyticus]
MKPEFQDLPLVDNSGSHRFELTVNYSTAFMEYGDREEALALFHTEVPAQLEGQGVGSALVEKVLAEVERRGQLLIPLCPFVTSYLKRHPEWQRLVAPGYQRWFQPAAQ